MGSIADYFSRDTILIIEDKDKDEENCWEKASDCRILHRSSSFYDVEAGDHSNDEDEEEPSLTASSGDSSDGSDMDHLLYSFPSAAADEEKQRRRLRFHPEVEVREYCVTVGDHPLCSDSLPLSLDWPHAEAYSRNLEDSKNRGLYYEPPNRLSLQDRRQRLTKVADFSDEILDVLLVAAATPEAVAAATSGFFGVLLGLLHQSLTKLWSAPKFIDVEEYCDKADRWLHDDDIESSLQEKDNQDADVVFYFERRHADPQTAQASSV